MIVKLKSPTKTNSLSIMTLVIASATGTSYSFNKYAFTAGSAIIFGNTNDELRLRKLTIKIFMYGTGLASFFTITPHLFATITDCNIKHISAPNICEKERLNRFFEKPLKST